jgi:pyruvate formate-lyase activating enzyme-like uncharacterized protein
MKSKKIFANSLLLGKLPVGCKLCVKGAKLVLFVTGLCNKTCWYCTISRARWQKDVTLADEIEVKKDSDILKEARLINAEGAGITGGEPILAFERTLHYIDILKSEFGKNFHIHLYTAYPPDKEKMKKLYKHGLDEIRFHLFQDKWGVIKNALEFDWDVGIEIPVITEYEERIKEILLKADELGVNFVNLNELEFSERNEKILLSKGYKIKENEPTAVKESEEVARRLLEFASKNMKSTSVHYCSAMTKNVFQLKNRWKRRAKSIKESYETVDENGLLQIGIIEIEEKELPKLLRYLKEKYKLSSKMMKIKNGRIETSVKIGLKIAEKEKNLKIFLVKQVPIENCWDVEKWPVKTFN